ncbi:MAG TPA: hypothetical protein VNW53_15010 [Phenylobacterium sp.]|jgi:hypothetical protein|uniref:hypothetical protein n=1 Tax=Phenylobacterium sp. TaxID=1871053 RepID=UPI002C2592D4|nr:hypothetical protein [Phenylobacterium sp.]HXA40305.1 hypothetical protein [Phenylobacterium sp.]
MARLDQVGSERLASVEQRLTDHEARCEERLGEIKHAAANTLRAVEGLKNRFWVIAVTLLAWAMAQVWAGSQARLTHLEAARPAALQEVADVAAH